MTAVVVTAVFHPAPGQKEALVEALESRLDTASAAYRLGQARSQAGVSITEAIDDMAVLFRAAGFESAPIRSIRSLCAGWTEGAMAAPAPATMADAESGLGTAEYLTQRLAEVYGAANRHGIAGGRKDVGRHGDPGFKTPEL